MKSEKQRIFRMKQFNISHRLSAMKVGVDAVLLGAWATLPSHGIILDAGCGCGIISLMLAQRSLPQVELLAIDTDPLAIIEAKENFTKSPWASRLSARRADFMQLSGKFSLIVSNPPFFRSGMNASESARMTARHADTLSPLSLLTRADDLLTPDGRLCLICPPLWLSELQSYCDMNNLYISKLCKVCGSSGGEITRLIIEFSRETVVTRPLPELSQLTVRDYRGNYTDEYRYLTREYYLNI